MKQKVVRRARWLLFLPVGFVVGLLDYGVVDLVVRLILLRHFAEPGTMLHFFGITLTGFLSGATATHVGSLVSPTRTRITGLAMLGVLAIVYGPDIVGDVLTDRSILAADRIMMVIGSVFVCWVFFDPKEWVGSARQSGCVGRGHSDEKP